MPGGDRTGPAGMGPMTGRAAGFCAGYNAPGFMNAAFGYGRGRGGGWGHRNRFYATGLTGWQRAAYGYGAPGLPYGPANAPSISSEQEIELLKEQARSLETALDGVRKRLDDLASNLKDS